MQVTKLFNICSAHKLIDPYSKRCENLHGHNYQIEVTLSGPVDNTGMVIDFKKLKEDFNYIIDAFDHSLVINNEDSVLVSIGPKLSSRYIIFPGNATAENTAQYLFNYINKSLLTCVSPYRCTLVTVWETPTSKAECGIAMWNGAITNNVPPMSISYAIASEWTRENLDCFTSIHQSGSVLPKVDLLCEIPKL